MKLDRQIAEQLYDPRRMSVKSQISFISKQLIKKGIDPDTVDLHALIDPELSYRENYKNIMASLAGSGKVGAAEQEIIKNPACEKAKELKQEISEHQKSDQKLQNLKAELKDAKTQCDCNSCAQMGLYDPPAEFTVYDSDIQNNPIIQKAMNQLLDMVKNGRFDVVARAVFKPPAGSRQKPSDSWSFSNRLIMLFNGTEDARGYNQWQEVGRYVKAGSKAFYILAPLTRKAWGQRIEIEHDPITGQDKEVLKKYQYDFIYGFRGIPVFRFEDTEGQPVVIEQIDYQVPADFQPIIRELGLTVNARVFSGDAYGYYSQFRREIAVMTPEIKTLLHEISHAVDDKLHGLRGGQHADQEVIAEFSAGTLGRLLGYDLPVGNIQRYIKSYDPSLVQLLSNLNRVEKVVNWIIERTTAKVVLQERVLYDPALRRRRGQRTLSGPRQRTLAERQGRSQQGRPPKNWFYAMVEGIRKRSDVRNPAAIVASIWRRLSPGKRLEIKRKEEKGASFRYDLPLPEDHATRGTGTVRVVKPFNLAEVQVNVPRAAYDQIRRSRLFQSMKRQDGNVALVKRCKSPQGNVNVFIDRG
ncbi:zincin-like metallopeptidase domain-containing protein [Candidatus Methanoperedens nitratireducens]|uniref:Antirestriction protein n=1 Tax=Candidatus Methanoperedens nitratireducens TaxID=1392998 RepID=A0A284VRY7_9EURY|nr:hypothetical protein [Candidatus Methanoperedens nitroreducens]SNQ62051.1 conserved hypothetical protein [Candidatus Methanoperedens nitroreducens]